MQSLNKFAPVVQWIERKLAEPVIEVRILSGAQKDKKSPINW